MKKLICILMALTVLLAFAACEAETEPVKKTTEGTQNTAPETEIFTITVEGTQNTAPETEIFTITVLHGDGEESSSRMTSECDNLAAALIERNFMTEDMLTIGGEKADPALGAYWTLYVDGVYATESWDQIPIEGGVEYMFEYTMEEIYEEPTDEEGEAVEDTVDETVEE